MFRKFVTGFVIAIAIGVASSPLSDKGFRLLPAWAVSLVAGGTTTSTEAPLLQSTDLVYEGAFRLPTTPLNDAVHTFNYMGNAVGVGMAFDPAGDGGAGSLLIPGMQLGGLIAEVGIPASVKSGALSSLNTASLIHDFVDPLNGHRNDVDRDNDSNYLGGLLLYDSKIIVTAYNYFDTNADVHPLSHFVTSRNLSSPAVLGGPYRVGAAGDAGWVAGAMASIPSQYQAALGGTHLSSQWGIPILGRTSAGPSASVFSAADLGVAVPVPATKVLGYPLTHATLGGLDASTQCANVSNGVDLFDCSVKPGGLVFPTIGRSVLFFGNLGTLANYCYGPGSTDPSMHCTVVGGENVSYDPVSASKGQHAYPYRYFVWAYDVNDLIAVKEGRMNYWDVRPYATWDLTFPINGGGFKIVGSAYDPIDQRIFLAEQFGDNDRPLIQVFKIQVGAAALCR